MQDAEEECGMRNFDPMQNAGEEFESGVER